MVDSILSQTNQRETSGAVSRADTSESAHRKVAKLKRVYTELANLNSFRRRVRVTTTTTPQRLAEHLGGQAQQLPSHRGVSEAELERRARVVAYFEEAGIRAEGFTGLISAVIERHRKDIGGIAVHTARHLPYLSAGLDLDDVKSIAAVAAMRVLDTFDPQLGAAFTTYLFRPVTLAVRHAITEGLDGSRRARELSRTIVESGKSWSVSTLVSAFSVHRQTALEALRLATHRTVSLEAPVQATGGNVSLLDAAVPGTYEAAFDSIGRTELYAEFIEIADAGERRLLTLFFEQGHSCKEIGALLHVRPERVELVLNEFYARCRKHFSDE